MLRIARTFGSFAVDDVDAARRFYSDTLGMKVTRLTDDQTSIDEKLAAEGDQRPFWLHGADGSDTLIYPRPDHAPAVFTVLNLSVDDIDEAIDELTARGVTFERYEGMDADDRGVVRADGRAVAWFTDPAGNILSVIQE